MSADKNVINLLYTMDDNFAMQAAVSMISLFENNPDLRFQVFIISDRISKENLEKLKSISSEYGHRIDIIDMPDLDAMAGVSLYTNGWSKVSYCRVFLAELLPDKVDKLIYLDPDTIVVDKITGLTDILGSEEFEIRFLAACLDSKSSFKRFHGFKRDEKYYNSGVLLVNLGLWRKKNLQKVFSDEIKRRRGRSIDPDQSLINCVLINKVMTLPARYNVMSLYYNEYRDYLKKSGYRPDETYSEKELKAAASDPVIIHFAGDKKFRPWYADCIHPEKEKWMHYFGKTGWKSFVPTEKAPYNPPSFSRAFKIRTVKILVQSPLAAKLYVRYKYGFIVRLYRKGDF
ncbi:MAG: glycosyltransferase family 8 protein [Lachnospiraceae bacterium]|nr:glycosyltransferase family 8 protein [Lachnospiraceae bacterium]